MIPSIKSVDSFFASTLSLKFRKYFAIKRAIKIICYTNSGEYKICKPITGTARRRRALIDTAVPIITLLITLLAVRIAATLMMLFVIDTR